MQQLPEGYEKLTLIEANHRSHVFRGRKNGEPVILKTVSQDNPSARAIERLQHEKEMLQLVASCAQVPHVVASTTVERRPFLTMTDLGANTLRSIIESESLSLTRALDVLIALAEAVGAVHRCGVVHKDLVPNNIIIRPELLAAAGDLAQTENTGEHRVGAPVGIIDFATATQLSRQYASVAPPSRLEGTLTHMAPEQTGRMGIGVDYRSDLYAVGVIAYQLFTGRLPFSASDPLGWCHCHLAEVAAPMREHRPELPDAVDAIVGKLMAKLPEERYQSAAGLVHDLRAVRTALMRDESLADFAVGQRDRAVDFRVPQRIYGRRDEIAALVRAYEDMADSGLARVVLVGG
ncbi:MAG: serine/threonine-protein kinase, partial [Myxococcota bacterium]